VEEALSLCPADRAELIERLFLSFDAEPHDSLRQQWASEWDARLRAYDQGRLEAKPVEDVIQRLRGQCKS
jgi:putative addiction module component (TIGR02574 family)